MERRRFRIVLGMVAAVVVCAGALTWALRRSGEAASTSSAALGLSVRWLLVPGLCLLAGIGLTARRRFVSAAVDGGPAAGDRAFDINLRYNQNTLEQTVLAAIAWTGLATAAPDRAPALIPVLAGLFAAGRASFWAGYLYAPWARAFGFGLTFYPTAVVLVWVATRPFG